ncbi:MAG: ParA family protein [Phycisphaerales bacterium]
MSRIVAFMNQKGGVGKTTTVVNLAAAIAQSGRSTLVIDLDPQAHATLHLGVDPTETDRSVYDLLLTPPDASLDDPAHDPEACIRQVREHLWLLPATTDLAAAETELAADAHRHQRLARAIDHLRPRFEFILIDCPPSLGLLTLNGLATAREVIVPMQAHFLALQGVGKLFETVSIVARSVNPRIRVSGVILCMHDEQTRHAREVVADLEQFFADSKDKNVPWGGALVYRPAIRRNIKLAEAPSFGQTAFEYAPTAPGALDYKKIADRLIQDWNRFVAKQNLKAAEKQDAGAATVSTRPAAPAEPRPASKAARGVS